MSRSAVIRDTEHANVQGIYYYLDVAPLTFQQEQFVILIFRGMSVTAACRATGLSAAKANALLEAEDTHKILNYMREQLFQDTRITLETLNTMTMEAHRKSVSSTEEISAINTLAKLNMIGGFAPKSVIDARVEASRRREEEKDITPNSMSQLERMEEKKLLQMANLKEMGELAPTPRRRVKASELEGNAWPESLNDLTEFTDADIEIIPDE